MTKVPDLLLMDTLGSLATLKNFPFRVQEKLEWQGKAKFGTISRRGSYQRWDGLLREAGAALEPQGTAGSGLGMHSHGNGVAFGFALDEDVVPGIHDVILDGLLGDRGGLRHCEDREIREGPGEIPPCRPAAIPAGISAPSPGWVCDLRAES